MKRQYIGMSPEEAATSVLLQRLAPYMATPGIHPDMVDEIIEAILSTGRVIRPEDAVDDKTMELVNRLVEQNRTLEKAASLYAEQVAMVDFIRLDRDSWKRRAEEAEGRLNGHA